MFFFFESVTNGDIWEWFEAVPVFDYDLFNLVLVEIHDGIIEVPVSFDYYINSPELGVWPIIIWMIIGRFFGLDKNPERGYG